MKHNIFDIGVDPIISVVIIHLDKLKKYQHKNRSMKFLAQIGQNFITVSTHTHTAERQI